ncbi:MAG: alpha amylase C-terminal domain-containing protein [Paludibacteraceae bacterium]|nr:alpha amylase C-terminal domain-containing protein [Paludibacteraceae bacterium]MBR1480415.1 alpha amylase C-terminal domain-containing protein [Paludibacteraceae bacterium]
MRKKTLRLIQSDPYLQPFEAAIQGRYDYALRKEQEITGGQKLSDWATGYLYFGLHRTADGWVLREWAPNATAIYLLGDANGWQKDERYRMQPLQNGVWELRLPDNALHKEQLYKLLVEWNGGWGERIPSYAMRVVQDEQSKIFSAQVWDESFAAPKRRSYRGPKQGEPLFIYECHIGMSSEQEKVNSYEEFRRDVLPRIASLGYNCLQIMAIQEHPYYGSFGYHVSNFFAASSRFGTPEELRALIDDAHKRGMAVIMDLVHSHAVKNEREGLGNFDGTPYQYFHDGARREHPAWDSLCFNYEKPEVLHFLLSNCKFWLDVYDFDGFRFDGVTSMIYRSHGLGEDFNGYDSYYSPNADGDAICYLTLANKLIHQVKNHAITIAEEMSGMPGLACPIADGGMGFDYRLAMGIPDFWIKYIKEVKDEDWKAGHIYYEMTNRRQDERTISYAESHDQALVGDKTIIFRLIDADMYWHFEHGHSTYMVDRGIALHKMIRLITASTINGGYLTFMGNEFGHPEWIDFPREGNGWSYKYARRQWSLVDNPNFYFADLNRFDEAMVHLLRQEIHQVHDRIGGHLPWIYKLWDNEGDQVVAYSRGDLVFVFNWNGQKSFSDYGILAPEGKYRVVLNTDAREFAGFGLSDDSVEHFTEHDPLYADPDPASGKVKGWLRLYLPARSAVVLKRE